MMEQAARAAGALFTASWKYYSSHTHADWTLRRKDGGDWPPADGTVYSHACDGSDITPTTDPIAPVSLRPVFSPASGSSYTASAGDVHTGEVRGSSLYGAYLYVNDEYEKWV